MKKIHTQNQSHHQTDSTRLHSESCNGFVHAEEQPATNTEKIFKTYYDYLKSYHPRSYVAVKKSKKHHQFFFGLETITPDDINAYKQKRLRNTVSDPTERNKQRSAVYRELRHCYAAYTRAINAGLTDRNPFEYS